MDPLSVGIGGAQLLLSIQNMMNGTSIANQNMQFQRQQAAEQKKLGQASRVDAQGNKQYYDPDTNTWKTQLSPIQEAIMKAGETEQYRSLTEDAARNRQLRTRQAQRSEDAVSPYNKAIQEFLNNPTQSEGSIRNEIATLTSLSNAEKGKTGQADLIRTGLRMGRGADIPAIVKATDDRAGQTVADTLLKSRGQAQQEHGQRESQRQSAYLPIIQQLSQTIDAGGGSAPQRFSNLNSELSASQNAQTSQMLSAIQAANSGINQASRTSIAASQNKPDFSGLLAALKVKPGKEERWDATPKKPDWTSVPDYLSDVTYGRQDSNGEYF